MTHNRSGYVAGCRCDTCTAANRDYHLAWKARNAGTLTADDPRHGKHSTYQNYRCRCDTCTAANRDYMRARRAKS